MRNVGGALAAAAILVPASAALAGPPHGKGGLVHHMHTGNGGCVQLDSRTFPPESRGLHQGGNESVFEQGVWHAFLERHGHVGRLAPGW